MTEATQYLVTVGDPDESVANRFVNPLDAFNYISPSAWVNDIIEKTTGVDIFGYASDAFTGEWVALYKFGDALTNVARAVQQIGIDIQTGAMKADETWNGNAGDAAYTYFSTLAAAVSGQQAALDAAARGYHEAARGAWQLSNQLGNVLQAVVDEAILMGIAAAVGTATIETGVGAVVGYGMAAYQGVQILKLVNKASQIINTAGVVIMAAFGGGMAIAGQGGDLSAVPLPSTAYALPRRDR
jgi:hypothetical protein